MKNLLFSLIYLSLFFPCFVFAQSETEDILNFINSPQTETSTQENDNSEQLIDAFSPQQQTTAPFSNLSPEDQEFMRQRPGESPNAYTLRIRVENLRRSAGLSEGPQLPNPTTSTTQIPENNTLRPPLETLPPMRTFQQQSSPRTTTSGTILDQIVPMGTAGGGNALNTILNQLFWAGLVIAVILAVVMIITGGIQYMTTDAMSGKEGGKDRIKAALGGLILAFSTIVILNTININLTEITLSFPKLNEDGPNIRIGGIDRLGVDNPFTNGTRPPGGNVVPAGTYGTWSESQTDTWVNSLQGGVRSTDGRLVVSVYSASGDSVTDSNTAARRGNADNLLREGSVALSPDLIQAYRPRVGQELFINGVSIGFFEDTTASEYNGVQFRNTIDIYDENVSLGSRNILQNVPAGEWRLELGETIRPQIANPSN